MQIIIEIPESEIPKQQDIIEIPLHFIDGKVCEAGGYGFDVLPKGHGRLIDERQINECKQVGLIIQDDAVTRCLVTDAPMIIEAERQSLQQIRINRQMRRNDADSN